MKSVVNKPRTLAAAVVMSIPFQLFSMSESARRPSSSWVSMISSSIKGSPIAAVVGASLGLVLTIPLGYKVGAWLRNYFDPAKKSSLPTAGFNMQKAGDIYRIASILRMDDALREKSVRERGEGVILSSGLRKKYEDRLKQLKAGGEWYYELADHGRLDSPPIMPFLRAALKEGTYSYDTIIQFLDIVHSLAKLRVIEVSAEFFTQIIPSYTTDLRYPFAEELLKMGVSLGYRPSDKNYSTLLDSLVYLGLFPSGHLGNDRLSPTFEGINQFITIPTLFVDVAEDIQKKCLASLSSASKAVFLKSSDAPVEVIKKIGGYSITAISRDDAFINEIADKIVTRINAWKEKYNSIPAGANYITITNPSRALAQMTWRDEKRDENLNALKIKIKNWCEAKQKTLEKYFQNKNLFDFKQTDQEREKAGLEAKARLEAEEITHYYERQEEKSSSSVTK